MSQTGPAAADTRTRIIRPIPLLVACMWAASNLATKWVLNVLDPSALLAFRMGIIGLLMCVLYLVRPRQRLAAADRTMLLVVGGGMVAVQVLTFAYAMKQTTASEGSLLISTAPAWTAVLVSVLRMERVSSLNWLGIGVASVGVAMIVLGTGGAMPAGAPSRLSGDLLMLASAWLYAAYMVFSRRWMQRFGELQVICLTFVAAGAALIAFGARQLLAADWGALTTGHWIAMAHMTLTGGFLGIVLWYWSIGRTSASGTAVYQYLVPVMAVLGAAAFLGERIGAVQCGGAAIALVGVCMAGARPNRPAPAQ